MLRPGGRFAVSDVIADADMDEATRADMAAYTGCIAGALTEDEFRAALAAAGLTDIEISRPTASTSTPPRRSSAPASREGMTGRGPALGRRAAAEAIGTFALVFAGCGAIVTDAERDGALGVVGIGLVFFLVLLAAIAALGHVSGAHFNPAVSLSFFVTRHLPGRDLAAYMAAQVAGAVARGAAAAGRLARAPGRPRRHRAAASPSGARCCSRWC